MVYLAPEPMLAAQEPHVVQLDTGCAQRTRR